MKIFLVLSLLLTVAVLAPTGFAAARPAAYLVYVGTSGGAKSKGVYAGRMDAKTGALSPFSLAAETPNASFVTIHPNNRFLYAVNATSNFGGSNSGSISAFAIDRSTGRLTPLNQQSSGGPGPCHLVVDRTGRHVLAANYNGGSICVLPINKDGSLGQATAFIQHRGSSVNPKRQDGPHAHGFYLDAGNRFAFVPDLGLDKVMIYKFDAAKGLLTPNDPPFAAVKPGSGPRHLAFHPNGRFAYVINELSSTVIAFACEAKRGALKEMQTVSTLPEDFRGDNTTAEIEVHPSGKFVYGSNRGHDSIAVFAIDQRTGKLTFVERAATRGKIPRNFAMDPAGKFLVAANQASDNLVVFRAEANTGRLTPTGSTAELPAPICVKFVPAND